MHYKYSKLSTELKNYKLGTIMALRERFTILKKRWSENKCVRIRLINLI